MITQEPATPVVVAHSQSAYRYNLTLLAIGQGLSRLGDGLYMAALVWTVWSVTQRAEAVALVTFAANLPAFAGTIIGASFADRYDRRRIMIGCDLVRAVLVLLVAALVQFNLAGIGSLAVVAALISLAGAPFAPARNALVPQVVDADKLLAANGLLQVSFRSAYFVGPLLFAPLLAGLGLGGVFLVDAATFLASIVSLAALRLHAAPQTAPAATTVWRDLAAGWRVLRQKPDVQIVIATFILAILSASGFLTVGLPLLVETRLHLGAGAYGALLGMAGLAEVAGALLFTRWRLQQLALAAVLGWSLLGLFRLPLGQVDAYWQAAGLLLLTGMASAVTDIPLIALVQARIPNQHLAKVLGLWEAGIGGAVAVAPPVAAFLLTQFGVAGGFALSGGILLVLGVGAALLLVCVPLEEM